MVPGQGEFILHLRLPGFSELLGVNEQVTERYEEFQKNGNWYPCDPPVLPTLSLLQVVIPATLYQCAEDGSALPPEETYSEAELMALAGQMREIYMALAGAWARLVNQDSDLGNDSQAGAERPCAPV